METIRRWYSNFLGYVVARKLKTHKEEISFPNEIMEDILSRLPVKSILRFRCVCKRWLFLISTPSFTKLQLTHATTGLRTAFFIIADDVSNHKKYFLSAAHGCGSVTHLMTVHWPHGRMFWAEEHLSGLVCSISSIGNENVVVNPSTRKVFKLPDCDTSGIGHGWYFFGFDESRSEHKILSMFVVRSTITIQIMIFSMSSYSWRKIDATYDISPEYWSDVRMSSVCVNSVIHLINVKRLEMLAFDLRTERFSIVKVPQEEDEFNYFHPHLIKINGCIGVVSHHHEVETTRMHIWILQDYENCLWVRETVTFPESWLSLGCPFLTDSINVDEIIFSNLKKSSGNLISALIYNMKSRCFRSIQFTLDHPILSDDVNFYQIKCYVESLVPL